MSSLGTIRPVRPPATRFPMAAPGRERRRRRRAWGNWRGWRPERVPRGERGMVTAELAVGVLSAALIAGMLCWVLVLIGLRTTCQDTAAQMARQLARGDRPAAQRARESIPDAQVSVDTRGEDIVVTVSAKANWGALGPIVVLASASVTREPGAEGV